MMDFLSNVDWGTVLATVTALLSAAGLGFGGKAIKNKYDQSKDLEQELAEQGIADAVAVEWRQVAEVRGEKIEDMQVKIAELETRIAHLEGAYAALETIKEERIAEKVVELLGNKPE